MSMVRNILSVAVVFAVARAVRRAGSSKPETPSDIAGTAVKGETRSERWQKVVVEGLLIGLVVASFSLGGAAFIDNLRSERELAASERLGWQVTFASSNSFQETDLSDTDLSGLNLRAFDFSRADFSGSSLMRAAMVDSDLAGADLTGADLTGAVLDGVSLVGSDLDGANLEGASLSGSDLSGSDVSRAVAMPRLGDVPLCYDADTKWPEGYDPPMLDWRSCWSGYDDSTVDSGARDKPTLPSCEVDSSDQIALDSYRYASSDVLCDYYGYVQTKVPRDSFSLLFTGASICAALGSEDSEGALSAAFGVGVDTNHRRQVLFAATRLLCPEHSAQLPDLIAQVD